MFGSAIRPILFLLDKDLRYSNTPLSDPYITIEMERQRDRDRERGDRGTNVTPQYKASNFCGGVN